MEDLVLISQSNVPPSHWPLGRITSDDNVVGSVEAKHSPNCEFKT